jgi:hypothetical protein
VQGITADGALLVTTAAGGMSSVRGGSLVFADDPTLLDGAP